MTEITVPVALTADEIRTAWAIRDRYLKAQAQMQMAAELEEDYFAQLRAKYKLTEGWQVRDLLTGFEATEGPNE